jgi:hypothetical protein
VLVKQWKIVPLDETPQENKKRPADNWCPVKIVGNLGTPPWNPRPFGVVTEPPLESIRLHLWQTVWFQTTLELKTEGLVICYKSPTN